MKPGPLTSQPSDITPVLERPGSQCTAFQMNLSQVCNGYSYEILRQFTILMDMCA